MLFQWFIERIDRWKRSRNWRSARLWKRETVWTDQNNLSAGWTVIVGFENGLGQRRTQIVQKPESPAKPSSSLMVEANEWLYEVRVSERPNLKVVR